MSTQNMTNQELADVIRRCHALTDLAACMGCPYQERGSYCQHDMALDAADRLAAYGTMRKPDTKRKG